jgi:DnaK suppressor protein
MINILPRSKNMATRISKKYMPNEKEKYMCEKHKLFFKQRLMDWKSEIIKSNNQTLYNNNIDDNSLSADIVDQASSYTEKNVEFRTINRQIKLVSKIDSALKRIKDGTYGFCKDTGDPIGLKRLIARPIATLSIAAQEKHEKEEKVYAD